MADPTLENAIAQPEEKQTQPETTSAPVTPATSEGLSPEQIQAMIKQAQESQASATSSTQGTVPDAAKAIAAEHDPAAAPTNPALEAEFDQMRAYASDPANQVPAGVKEKLNTLVGREVGVLSSVTPDTYKYASLNTVVLTVPTDPTLSVSEDAAAIKANLQKDPTLAALLTEPVGRKLEKMLADAPVTETPADPSVKSDPNGFNALEKAALSGWGKPMDPPQAAPTGDGFALVFKVDEQDKAKIFDNLNGRKDAIAEQITTNGKVPVDVSVEQAPDGIAIVLKQKPGANPTEQPAADMDKVVNHAILYAGDKWQEAFGVMSNDEQRKGYLKFLSSEKNPEVKALLASAQENTGPSFSKIIGPIPEHRDEFRVELVLPKGQTSEQFYSAFASGAESKAATPQEKTYTESEVQELLKQAQAQAGVAQKQGAVLEHPTGVQVAPSQQHALA